MTDIKSLEKLVGRYQDENRPLLIKEEIKYDSSGDEFEDLESGNPRVNRIIKYLKNENPYSTLFKSVAVIGGVVIGFIGGIKVYQLYC